MTTNSGVDCITFSPDGNKIISDSDQLVQVWDAKTGELLRELQGHGYQVESVAFSSDGNKIVSGSQDLLVWCGMRRRVSC